MTPWNVRFCVYALLSVAALASAGETLRADDSASPELSYELKEAVLGPVREWAGELGKEKNADNVPFKKIAFSQAPRKVDDTTYRLTAHVNTVQGDQQQTERFELTIQKTPAKGAWEITDKKVVDTLVGLYRANGVGCFPFESFKLDREGMKLSGSNGRVCTGFMQGGIPWFALNAANLEHSYAPPEHARLTQTSHDFYAAHKLMSLDHKEQLEYKADAFYFSCDAQSCERILNECFTGLKLPTKEERGAVKFDATAVDPWMQKTVENVIKDRKKDAFDGFRALDRPGRVFWSTFVSRDFDGPGDGVWLAYDNWGGWEVRFGVTPKRYDVPDQLEGAIFGYFSEETVKHSDPYSLERREDNEARWFEVHGLKGVIDLATDDPEQLHGDVNFDLKLKQDVKELPFFIISFDFSKEKPKPIVVNSLEVDGQEVTWVQTGPISGRMILPKELPAGSTMHVRMDWKSQCLIKYTHSYSYMPRGGWMPFVSFGDTIDDFELTIRSPQEYEIIGIGRKIDERVEGRTRISHWKANSPVNFPTIIIGRYESDKPKFDAKKLDGTVIPITVHVDEASFGDWDIRSNALKPIGEQAANSINLYAGVTGLDYPFGELNLVNDPLGFLYGQAPSSIIYLGSGVFRGEGSLAPFFRDSTSIARFLRSVVAHEVGHQWWGNTIANFNDRNYWFVESLAEYFSAIYLEAMYGWEDYQHKVEDWRRTIMDSNLKGSVQNAGTLFSGEEGGGRDARTAAIYNRGPYAFHMLRELYREAGPRGPEGADKRFFKFLKDFSQELAKKREIVTLDIQQAAEKALGGVDANGKPFNADLGWFFDQWIRGAGIPEYTFNYDVNQAEDGGWIIKGVIKQRVFLGNTSQVLEGSVYRGYVDLTVTGKGGPYPKRVKITAAETPVLIKVPVKPVEIKLNEKGEMLARDTRYNKAS